MTNPVAKAASTLGRRALGKKKRITPSDRARRRAQMVALNRSRRSSNANTR